jgi:hypothetical protein
MENFTPDPKDFLLFVLENYHFEIKTDRGNAIDLQNGYTIEIEGADLYRLLENGSVIAPFTDLDELCYFMKMG